MSEIPEDVKAIIGGKSPEDVAITVVYKNWRGETAERRIIPIGVSFGSTDYHPQPQWLLRIYDLDKKSYRDYALKDIESWTSFPS
ncbi:MAG: hypothetical protein ABH864_01360 [archaeon]